MAEAGGRPQLTVVSTDGDSRVARLHRYIARRDDLRATFQTLWQKLEAGPVGAWQEEWAAAALRLFEVNAGPAVQMAFWRLSLAEAPRCEASALVAAADTADIEVDAHAASTSMLLKVDRAKSRSDENRSR